MRLLLVEDEAAIACRIRESLEEAHYTVDWARDGVEALALALALSLSGPVLAKKAAPKKAAPKKAVSKAVTCPVCHMALTTKKTKTRPQGVMIGGKTYYCCAGCDMMHAKGNKILQGG